MKRNFLRNQHKITLSLNPNLYSLEAIYGACYVFVDRAYIFLDVGPKKKIQISFKGKDKLSPRVLNNLVGEFQNELLNYSLRAIINKNNRKIRDYIVGSALFSASSDADILFEEDKKASDYLKDPLGIAIPWEEKYREVHGKTKVK